MSAQRDLWVFAYDIASDRARARVGDVLEQRLARVQLSLFEGRLTRAQALAIIADIRPMLDDGDKLRVYRVELDLPDACIAVGGAPPPEQQEFWLL